MLIHFPLWSLRTSEQDLLRRLPVRLPGQPVDVDVVPVLVLPHHVPEERDVADGQLERVHLAQPLLVRQRGDVRPQALEGLVDALHATSLPQVGRLPLLGLLRGALGAPQLGTPVAEGNVAKDGRELLGDPSTGKSRDLHLVVVVLLVTVVDATRLTVRVVVAQEEIGATRGPRSVVSILSTPWDDASSPTTDQELVVMMVVVAGVGVEIKGVEHRIPCILCIL